MKRILATAATALTGLGLALTSAAPAQASDATLKFFDSAGNVVAKAWYDDLTDNLCVVSYRDRQTATVQIGPAGGGTRASRSHSGFGKAPSCTGNMSIAEDRSFWMIASYPSRSSKDTTFFT
jgi:hypothetical protein